MASIGALKHAAKAWCTPKTKHMNIDRDLQVAIAEVIDELLICPKTDVEQISTIKLIDELKFRTTSYEGRN